jgi:hypothetical protein
MRHCPSSLFVHQFFQTPAGASVWIDALGRRGLAFYCRAISRKNRISAFRGRALYGDVELNLLSFLDGASFCAKTGKTTFHNNA